jgi:hypothetical protein
MNSKGNGRLTRPNPVMASALGAPEIGCGDRVNPCNNLSLSELRVRGMIEGVNAPGHNNKDSLMSNMHAGAYSPPKTKWKGEIDKSWIVGVKKSFWIKGFRGGKERGVLGHCTTI